MRVLALGFALLGLAAFIPATGETRAPDCPGDPSLGKWQLWRVVLDGRSTIFDRPPPGQADESPRWSRSGSAILFVRERNGYGRLMLWRKGVATGPFANLGYSLGYYGHHAWALDWTAAA